MTRSHISIFWFDQNLSNLYETTPYPARIFLKNLFFPEKKLKKYKKDFLSCIIILTLRDFGH